MKRLSGLLHGRRAFSYPNCRVKTRLNSSNVDGMAPKTKGMLDGIVEGKRPSLAKAITLIESKKFEDVQQAEMLLHELSSGAQGNKSKGTFRIGIAGPPGAGKSTFIEKLGLHYLSQGSRVAVIAVDPSSHISGGSILGDKTRMTELTVAENAYVRASPTRGVLGGIAEHTSDVVFLCESTGYDVIIVESVGLGQSEIAIERAVDMTLLLVPPGGGDDLQASKKGIMEAADVVIVNKADGALMAQAKHTKADYSGQLKFVRPKSSHWMCKALLMSNHSALGFDKVTATLEEFRMTMSEVGQLARARAAQSEHWMWVQLQRDVMRSLDSDAGVARQARVLRGRVGSGVMSSRVAARQLLQLFLTSKDDKVCRR